MDAESLLRKAADALSVSRAFGPAVEQSGTLVVPVAMVAGGGGGGGAEASPSSGEAGAGSGGGFGGVTWPLGVYVLRDGKVRWVPVVDVTRIVLAALAMVRAVVKLRALHRLGAHRPSPR